MFHLHELLTSSRNSVEDMVRGHQLARRPGRDGLPPPVHLRKQIQLALAAGRYSGRLSPIQDDPEEEEEKSEEELLSPKAGGQPVGPSPRESRPRSQRQDEPHAGLGPLPQKRSAGDRDLDQDRDQGRDRDPGRDQARSRDRLGAAPQQPNREFLGHFRPEARRRDRKRRRKDGRREQARRD